MNITSVIEKLIQLALKNPNPEEASAAAMKAVRLIESYQIPIGADVTVVREVRDWKPPTAEESSVIEDLLNGRSDPAYAKAYASSHHAGKAEGLITQDNTPMTGQDAFRQRLVDAWRALREERKRLDMDIYDFNQRTGSRYTRGGEW